jgi:hypothetical protein
LYCVVCRPNNVSNTLNIECVASCVVAAGNIDAVEVAENVKWAVVAAVVDLLTVLIDVVVVVSSLVNVTEVRTVKASSVALSVGCGAVCVAETVAVGVGDVVATLDCSLLACSVFVVTSAVDIVVTNVD